MAWNKYMNCALAAIVLSSVVSVVESRNCSRGLGCFDCRDAGGVFCEKGKFYPFPSVCVCSGFGTGFFGGCHDHSFGTDQPEYCDFFLEVGVYLIPGLGIPLLIVGWFCYTFVYRANRGLITQGGVHQEVQAQPWAQTTAQPYSHGVKGGDYLDEQGNVPVARVAQGHEFEGRGMNPQTRNVYALS